MITVVIISFYSRHHILDRIKEIGTSVPIVIVENSQDFELKKNRMFEVLGLFILFIVFAIVFSAFLQTVIIEIFLLFIYLENL